MEQKSSRPILYYYRVILHSQLPVWLSSSDKGALKVINGWCYNEVTISSRRL